MNCFYITVNYSLCLFQFGTSWTSMRITHISPNMECLPILLKMKKMTCMSIWLDEIMVMPLSHLHFQICFDNFFLSICMAYMNSSKHSIQMCMLHPLNWHDLPFSQLTLINALLWGKKIRYFLIHQLGNYNIPWNALIEQNNYNVHIDNSIRYVVLRHLTFHRLSKKPTYHLLHLL